jgi:MFS superfamily sulfate permease-like transporter
MQITDVHTLYKKAQYYDLVIWLVTAIAVILTDVDLGLFIGVGFSLLTIVFRTQRPHTSVLGRIPQTDLYEDIKAYPMAREIPGIKIFSFTSSLYYANAEFFAQQLYKKSRCNPEIIKLRRAKQQRRLDEAEKKRQKEKAAVLRKKKRLHITAEQDDKMFTDDNVTSPAAVVDGDYLAAETGSITESANEVKLDLSDIILDFSSMMFIDSVGISALQQVMQDYKDIGVRVLMAGCRKPVFEHLSKAGVFKKADQCNIYVAVHDAVLAAVGSHSLLYEQLKRDINGPLGSVLNETMYTDTPAVDSADHKLNGAVTHRINAVNSTTDEELLTLALESAKF